VSTAAAPTPKPAPPSLRRARAGLAMLSVAVLALVWWWGDLAGPAWAPTTVVINEVVASNASTAVDEDGDASDWIELWNPTEGPVDVGGYFLSDDPLDPRRWELPARIVEPDAYLLVYASGKDRAGDGELPTSFRLDRAGEPLLLSDPEGLLVDRIDGSAFPRDASLGRDPQDPARRCWFAFPTPGTANAPRCFEDEGLGVPTLSATSGFSDAPFDLVIDAPPEHGPILYTLDGSYPDPDRNPDATDVYEASIRIADRSGDPEVLAALPSTFPLEDVPWMSYEWRAPASPVPKATVVRARTEHGAEVAATYFVGAAHRRSGLPVISLALDPDHLFDPETGIYVPGQRFLDHLAAGGSTETRADTPANHEQRGREWERPPADDLRRAVVLDLCEPEGVCTHQREVGIRTHGNWSRSLPAKSLRLYARSDYGASRFEYPFFGESAPTGHRRLLLRNSGQDWGMTLLQDGYLQQLVSHLAVETQAYRPTVLYLNGEYWGIHNLRERYDQHYFEVVHGVDPEDVVLVGQGLELDVGDPADLRSYRQLLQELADTPSGAPEVAERLRAEVDLASLMDHLIVQLFTANDDWPQANVALWRTRTAGDVPAADGRWRWLVEDLDHAGRGFGRRGLGHGTALEKDAEARSLERVWFRPDDPTEWEGIPLLVSSLLEDEGLRTAFLSRFADHLNTTFAPERTVAELDRLEALLEPEMGWHVERWSYPGSVAQWRGHVDALRGFMQARPAAQRAQLAELLEDDGLVAVAVEHDVPAQGSVRVNSIELTTATPGVSDATSWQGEYFAGLPVELEAVPAEGYRFVAWDGAPMADRTSARLRTTFEEDVRLRPIFERS
jgi:hypothetical protein